MKRPSQDNLTVAMDSGWEALAAADLARVCQNASAQSHSAEALDVVFAGEPLRVNTAERTITRGGRAASPRTAVLALHYLTQADGTELSGREIGFAQIPGAEPYYRVFQARILQRMIRTYAPEPKRLTRAAQVLGGSVRPLGDTAVTVALFPRVPVSLILWHGDEELDPAGQWLFDQSVSHYLSIEDAVVGCELLLRELAAAEQEEA
jgi:hypothetical protein